MQIGAKTGYTTPAYVDSTQAWNSSATAFTPSAPTGLGNGDFMVAICISTTASRTWSATGWTSVSSVNATHSIAVLKRVSTGSDSFTFNISGAATNAVVFLFAYRGAATVLGDNLATATFGTADPQIAASMSVTKDRILLAVLEVNNNTVTLTSGPSGMTSREQQFSSSTPRGAVYDLVNPSTGASGTKSFDVSASVFGTAFLVEIQ